MIIQMEERHLDQVVEVHLKSFSGFFLTFMGRRFLKLLYLAICRDQLTIKLAAISDSGEIIGFVAGSLDPSGYFSKLLKRNWWRLSLASLEGIIKRPSIIPRIARAIFYPSHNPSGENVAMLMSLGVSPVANGKGIGKELVSAFLYEADDRGVKKVFLTTDRDNNDKVNKFYQKIGFKKTREYVTKEGRWMIEYLYEIGECYSSQDETY